MPKILLFVMITVLMLSCRQNDNINVVLDNEKEEISTKTKEILEELGFFDYSIKIFYHKSIGNIPASRSVKSIKAVGDGLLPVLESISDYDPVSWDGYIKTFTNDFNGYFEQRTTVSNYDFKRIGNMTIIYDYISLLIIFDDISDKQKDELLKIINMYIGNANRGDTIYITSKKLLGE